MKSKLLLLTLLLICQTIFSQNAPSIEIGKNTFSGRNLEKVNKTYETLNLIDYNRRVAEIKILKTEIATIFGKIKVETDPAKDSELRDELKKKETELVEKEIEKDRLWNEYVKDYLNIRFYS